jgi:hypothetical protein
MSHLIEVKSPSHCKELLGDETYENCMKAPLHILNEWATETVFSRDTACLSMAGI